jgi:hypothetical protein
LDCSSVTPGEYNGTFIILSRTGCASVCHFEPHSGEKSFPCAEDFPWRCPPGPVSVAARGSFEMTLSKK